MGILKKDRQARTDRKNCKICIKFNRIYLPELICTENKLETDNMEQKLTATRGRQ